MYQIEDNQANQVNQAHLLHDQNIYPTAQDTSMKQMEDVIQLSPVQTEHCKSLVSLH